MSHDSKKLSIKNRRGISNIIGSLIVLAIVASVGSVILFQGLNQINNFNYDLSLHNKEKVSELREDLIFENVRFDPTSKVLQLNIANIGSVDTTIAAVTMVKIDTQDLILSRVSPQANATIPVEDHTVINLSGAILSSPPNDIWNSSMYNSSTYKITITTSKGNFFEKIAEPYNS